LKGQDSHKDRKVKRTEQYAGQDSQQDRTVGRTGQSTGQDRGQDRRQDSWQCEWKEEKGGREKLTKREGEVDLEWGVLRMGGLPRTGQRTGQDRKKDRTVKRTGQ